MIHGQEKLMDWYGNYDVERDRKPGVFDGNYVAESNARLRYIRKSSLSYPSVNTCSTGAIWRHMAMVCCSYCKPAGSRRWRRGKGGRESITTPLAAAAVDTSVLVPGRGGGGGGGGDDDDNDVVAPSWSPDLESNGGDRSDGRPPRGLAWGWRAGRSEGRLGVSSMDSKDYEEVLLL